MSHITVQSLPKLDFAHSFQSVGYENTLLPFPNFLEISYVRTGTIKLVQDNCEYYATAGDFICNPKTSAVFLSSPSNELYEHRTVSFYLSYSDYSFPLITHIPNPSSVCYSLLDDIIRRCTLYPTKTNSTAGLFLQLLDELEMFQQQDISQNYHNPYVQQAKEYIYDHIHEPIHQRDVATALGITPEYLCSIFKKNEGVSLIPFINRTKLKNIRILTEQKGFTLQQAASQYGYADPSYVSRLYKKMFGHNITINTNKKGDEQLL